MFLKMYVVDKMGFDFFFQGPSEWWKGISKGKYGCFLSSLVGRIPVEEVPTIRDHLMVENEKEEIQRRKDLTKTEKESQSKSKQNLHSLKTTSMKLRNGKETNAKIRLEKIDLAKIQGDKKKEEMKKKPAERKQ